MKNLMKSVVLVSALVFAAPLTALAGGSGGATGIGTGIAESAAGASIGKTNNLNLSGSVGAAQCANAFSILGIAASMSDKGCDLVMAAVQGYGAGIATRNEAREIYFAGVAKMGLKFKEPAAPATVSTKAAAAPAATKLVTINGQSFNLSGENLELWLANKSLTFKMADGSKVHAKRSMIN